MAHGILGPLGDSWFDATCHKMTSMAWFSVQRCHFSRKKLDGTGSDIDNTRMRVDTHMSHLVAAYFTKWSINRGTQPMPARTKNLILVVFVSYFHFQRLTFSSQVVSFFVKHEENQVIECKQKQSGEREREE